MTKLRVHLCTKCGEQTISSLHGSLHKNDSTDHLTDSGRILTLDWDPGPRWSNVLMIHQCEEG
jgi:hypothetical protein